jgi:hypothetical protein
MCVQIYNSVRPSASLEHFESPVFPRTCGGMLLFHYVRVAGINSRVQWSYLIWCEHTLLISHRISYIKPVEMSSEYYPWALYLFDHYGKWIIMHSHRGAARRYSSPLPAYLLKKTHSVRYIWYETHFIYRLREKGENSIASIWRNSRCNTGFTCVCVGGGGV